VSDDKSTVTKLAAVKKEVQGYLAKWVPATGLGWWSIHAVWEYDVIHGAPNAIALTSFQWEYLSATIVFNVPKLLNLDTPEEREEVVVHELAHVLLAEIPNAHKDRERYERAATILEHALMWVRRATKAGDV